MISSDNQKPHPEGYCVLAPDLASGQDFYKSFQNTVHKIPFYLIKVAPRVIKDKVNEDPMVTADLAYHLHDKYSKGCRNVIIACNTLQFWVEKAKKLLEEMGFPTNTLNVITTFEAIKNLYPDRKIRPVWLGTSVTASLINKNDFDTPLSLGYNDIQDLIQEVIWRVKGVNGSDISTSGFDLEDLKSEKKLFEKVAVLIEKLHKNGLNKVVLGCTELPMAVGLFDIKTYPDMQFINPADIIAHNL